MISLEGKISEHKETVVRRPFPNGQELGFWILTVWLSTRSYHMCDSELVTNYASVSSLENKDHHRMNPEILN